ncbi:glycosyltransferase family 2 protein [Shewanella xiamenensis]|uniref:glycosyltransferase family 2 protein n=1 Tax=Shewanella xiamenensis TaxID=332186 RepID=UPI001CC4988B|nr:glycosyltransferase [Shewanella xiamenensis]BDA59925.1 hypothetical protein NUITMVS1_13880 [Shewanella xiamenensis]
MMKLAICVICFNRKFEFARLINCLLELKTSLTVDLIVSVDFSSEQQVINEVASSIDWPFGDCRIILHDSNLGLKKHVLSCGDLSSNYDGLILLEDDLIVSPYVIDYVAASLGKLGTDDSVAGISLYSYMKKESNKMPFIPFIDSYDSYFVQFPSSWGFVVTAGQWSEFKDWLTQWDCTFFEDDLIPDYICKWGEQSWKKHLVRYLVHRNKYFAFPRFSLSTNPGANGTHHNGINSLYSVPICLGPRCWHISSFENSSVVYDVDFLPVEKMCKSFPQSFNDGHISLGTRIDSNKADHVFNNYFFTVREYVLFSFVFFSRNAKKLLVKLGFKK